VRFHESFWVVVGSAAPVLVLAAVVSVTDAVRQMFDFSRPDDAHRSDWPVGWAISGRVLSGLQLFAALVIIVLGAVALNSALGSILFQRNEEAPLPIISGVATILVLLLSVGLLSVAIRLVDRRIKRIVKKAHKQPAGPAQHEDRSA
jgi:hypothetical protein